MLLKLYIASIVSCSISLLFYILRLRKHIYVFGNTNLVDLILAYLVWLPGSLIPIVNMYLGLTWIINAFFISEDEFIFNHLEN